MAGPNWEQIERDVVERIRFLRAVHEKLDDRGTGLKDKIYNDLIVPNLKLLARFCACCEIGEGHEQEPRP